MFSVWMLLLPPLLGARAFMIYNTEHGLCLEELADEVLVKKCNLDSVSQQWLWMDKGMLMCVASSRCLAALQGESLQAMSCWGPQMDAAGLMWDCDKGRLISQNTSMLLSIEGQRPILTHNKKQSKWRSLDEGDICKEKLRSRRASDDPEEFEVSGKQSGSLAAMTMIEEQREYLRWYYRTENATTWTFVLLGLAFVCLLIGFLLLGMGVMANKNRKKIAKYKAAASNALKSEGDELQVISLLTDGNSSSKPIASLDTLLEGNKASPSNGEMSELKAGNIMVTWKDGNTSSLYSNPAEGENQEEASAAELESEGAVQE